MKQNDWDGAPDNRYRPMDPAREWMLLEQWRTAHDTEAREELARAYMGRVKAVARKIRTCRLDLADREGVIGLRLAVVFDRMAKPGSTYNPGGSLAHAHRYFMSALYHAVFEEISKPCNRQKAEPLDEQAAAPASPRFAARQELAEIVDNAKLTPRERHMFACKMDGIPQVEAIRLIGLKSIALASREEKSAMEKMTASAVRGLRC